MMRMLLAVVTVACLVGALSLRPAEGEDTEAGQAQDVWMFDVRVVRVDAATPEAVETPTLWEAVDSCTVDSPWPLLLAHLKARGKTTLLLDQRITALGGTEALISQTGDRQFEQLQSRDLSNERYAPAPVVTGATAKMRVADGSALNYQVEARWVIRPGVDRVRPMMRASKWAGTYRAIPNGRTLVLSYREQIDTWGESRVGTEIHAFLTMRRLP